jgi:NADPH-dependent 2,4-dienoyl-CoA reductase/sulfur reductase-like enzyme
VKSVAVVGASLAGLSAARALRAQGFDGELTIVGAETRRPYDRPPLSKEFLAGDVGEDALALEADDDDLKAQWLIGVHATRLDAAAGAVHLDDGTTVRADGIVVATGARARSWPASARLAGVHVLRTVDDAIGLRRELRPGARLVVIGAGFIGGEVASTAAKLGLHVTVVEAALAPLAGPLGVRLGAAVARLHTEHGTRLLCGAPVADLTGRDRVTGVQLADGRRLAADVVLVGIGAIPNVEWLRNSPLEISNGVVCDEGGATSIPNVVAVGDCAAWHEPSVGWPHRVEHWTGALERPAIAVATLLAGGRHDGAPAKPPYFWSDQYGRRIQFAGIAAPGDEITFEVGTLRDASFLAVYRRGGEPVAVLGVDQPRLFTRLRRQLAVVPVPA